MDYKKRKIGLTLWFLMFSTISVLIVTASLFFQIYKGDIDISDLKEVQPLRASTFEKPITQIEKPKVEVEQDFF